MGAARESAGIGLAVVYGILRQHRGWVKVHSRIGQGTRFELHLPAYDPARTFAGSAPGSVTSPATITADDSALQTVAASEPHATASSGGSLEQTSHHYTQPDTTARDTGICGGGRPLPRRRPCPVMRRLPTTRSRSSFSAPRHGTIPNPRQETLLAAAAPATSAIANEPGARRNRPRQAMLTTGHHLPSRGPLMPHLGSGGVLIFATRCTAWVHGAAARRRGRGAACARAKDGRTGRICRRHRPRL